MDYGVLETKVIQFFNTGTTFHFKGKECKVLISAKPKTQKGGGEPKTDVFIRAQSISDGKIIDLKISVKMKMANIFVENKITKERFNEIFYSETKEKIKERLYKDVFPEILKKIKRIYVGKKFPLGWKCEIAINDTRRNRVRVLISPDEADEIYSGKKRPTRFKDAKVNGVVIKNAGIADYILSVVERDIKSPKDVISQMVLIQDYVQKKKNRIFDIILTGLNLFIKEDKNIFLKWDGDRPLLVGVKWVHNEIGKLQGIVDLENLFAYKGNNMAKRLSETLSQVKVLMDSSSSFWASIQDKISDEQLIFQKGKEFKKITDQKQIPDLFNT